MSRTNWHPEANTARIVPPKRPIPDHVPTCLVGVFTERDVLNRVACQVEDLTHAHISDFMTPEPFALQADMPIKHALHLMSDHGFRHLPLVDDDFKPDGVISFRDVVRHLKERLS
jgi:CBS domain-containing protein